MRHILFLLLIFFFANACFAPMAGAKIFPWNKQSRTSEVASAFTEEKRKIIFHDAIGAEKKGTAEADRQYPNDLGQNMAIKQQLTTKYRRDVLKKHGLTEDSREWRLIAEEGVKKKWI